MKATKQGKNMFKIKKTIKAGESIEIIEYTAYRYGKGNRRGKYKKPTCKAQKKRNINNAEEKLKHLIKANFVNGDIYCTFTFGTDERPKTPEEAKKIYSELLRYLKKAYRDRDTYIKYISTTGKSSKGNIHFHFLLQRISTEDIKRLWKYGNVIIKPLDTQNFTDIIEYFMKEKNVLFNKRWNSSKNLTKPKITVDIICGE